MKKVIAVLMIATLVLFSVSAAYAAENDTELENESVNIDERFEQWAADEYQAKLCQDGGSYTGGGIGYYEPEVIYRHTDADNRMDWALIKVYSFPELDWEIAMRIEDLIISSGGEEAIFAFGYGIYDANSDTFYDIYDIRNRIDDYPDLDSAAFDLEIGRPIGDADADGLLTVLDATRVQRILADLDPSDYSGSLYYLYEPGTPILESSYYADMDGDGRVTILDATDIQFELAGLE